MSDSNKPTISALCEEDQNDRYEYLQSPSPEAWREVIARDAIRRKQVVTLMRDGAMQTAKDYFDAGLIMVHGDDVDELTLAHVFATAAQAKGHEAAAWLSAITLDRMLQSLGKGQVFDTQPPTKADNVTMYKPVAKTVFVPQNLTMIFNAPSGEV